MVGGKREEGKGRRREKKGEEEDFFFKKCMVMRAMSAYWLDHICTHLHPLVNIFSIESQSFELLNLNI